MKKKMTVLLLAVMVLSMILVACKSGVDIQSGEVQPATGPAVGHTQDATEVPEQMIPAETMEPDNGGTTAVETEPENAGEKESAPTESDWNMGEESFDTEEETGTQDPTETEPIETEDVETEPAETLPVETEHAETKSAETETEQTDPTEIVPPTTESDEDNWNIGEEDF